MAAKKYHIKLSGKERQQLSALTRKGIHETRMINPAQILLLADEKRPYKNIATYLHCSEPTVTNICQRYCTQGMEAAISEKSRPGAPRKLNGRFEAKVTAVACSSPPEGYSRWTLRLLADRLVELGFTESISHTQVGCILEKNDRNHGNTSNGVLVTLPVNFYGVWRRFWTCMNSLMIPVVP